MGFQDEVWSYSRSKSLPRAIGGILAVFESSFFGPHILFLGQYIGGDISDQGLEFGADCVFALNYDAHIIFQTNFGESENLHGLDGRK